MGESAAIARTDPPTSGHARHIGRVGALAFALGIGAAVLAGAGAASADSSDSGTGTTSASTSSSTSSDTDSDATAGTQAESESESADEPEDAPDITDTDSDDASGDESVDAEVDADADGTEQEADDETAPPDDDSAPADADADAPPAAKAESAAARRSTPSVNAAQATVAESPNAVAAAPNPFFSNVTPTLGHDPAENSTVGGVIVGALNPVDPDSTKLTYSATRPSHGTVAIDKTDGTFIYTPGATYPGQDRFDVTISDASSGFHIHGFSGLLNLLSFGLLGSSGHRSTETVFIGFDRAVAVDGLNSPVDFRFLPDGRIVVAEKGGAIRLVENGVLREQPLISLSVSTGGERGISGLAVDPNFGTNGYIYAAYTTSAVKDRLSRFTIVGTTAGSEKVLVETTETVALFHHGGALAFGPDGKLYWGKGDNTVGSNAQNLSNIYGKILRLNPEDGSAPADNPLIEGARSQIYAYGLRNPFRLAFTPDGKLLVADVGAASFEELNLVTAGGNYGWPGSEGLCTSNCGSVINPIHSYPRGSGAAITSVVFYNGGALGAGNQNKVFIADTVQGWIKVLTCTPDFTSCGNVQTFDPDGGATVVLAQGPGGYLYQLTYSPGELIRIGTPQTV